MTGPHILVFILPIIMALALILWIGGMFYANRAPDRGSHSVRIPTEVRGGTFQAREGGRQLTPIHGYRAAVARGEEPDELPPAMGMTDIQAPPRSAAREIQLNQAALTDEPPPAPVLVEVVPPARRPAAAPAGHRVPGQRPDGTRPSARQVANDARNVAEDSVRLVVGRVAGTIRPGRKR